MMCTYALGYYLALDRKQSCHPFCDKAVNMEHITLNDKHKGTKGQIMCYLLV